jgi:hypothetical protein
MKNVENTDKTSFAPLSKVYLPMKTFSRNSQLLYNIMWLRQYQI